MLGGTRRETSRKRKHADFNDGPEPMVIETAQEDLVDGEVKVSLQEKLEKEYGKGFTEDTGKIRMIPLIFNASKASRDSPSGAEAEHAVYNALKNLNEEKGRITHYFSQNQLKLTGFVFHDQKFDDQEIDFFFITPYSLIIIECKGVKSKTSAPNLLVNACEQLDRQIPKLLNSLNGMDDIPVFKVVAFPLLTRCDVEPMPGTHVLFKDDLANLKTWLRRKSFFNSKMPSSYANIVKTFLVKYHGKFSYHEFKKRGISDCNDKLQRLEKILTREQAAILKSKSGNVWCEGAAGTGKTVVLLERVKKLVQEDNAKKQKRILVIVYNRALKNDIELWLHRCLEKNTRDSGKDLVRVQTFSALLEHILKAVPEDMKPWSNDNRPTETGMIDFILQSNLEKYFKSNFTKTSKYRHILVDEAQDLPGKWLKLLFAMLNKKENPCLWVFQDPFQVVRRDAESPDTHEKARFTHCYLTKVLRNTHNTFQAYQHCYDSLCKPISRLKPPAIDHDVHGLPTQYIPADDTELHPTLISTLQELQRKKVAFYEVAVITCGNTAIDDIKNALNAKGIESQNAEDGTKLKYTKNPAPHVIVDSYQRFKGLEAKVVIFCIPDGWEPRDQDVYVGYSRAFCHLIVIGPKKFIDQGEANND